MQDAGCCSALVGGPLRGDSLGARLGERGCLLVTPTALYLAAEMGPASRPLPSVGTVLPGPPRRTRGFVVCSQEKCTLNKSCRALGCRPMTSAVGLLLPPCGLVLRPPALCPESLAPSGLHSDAASPGFPGGPGHPGSSAENAPVCRLPGLPVDPLPALPRASTAGGTERPEGCWERPHGG